MPPAPRVTLPAPELATFLLFSRNSTPPRRETTGKLFQCVRSGFGRGAMGPRDDVSHAAPQPRALEKHPLLQTRAKGLFPSLAWQGLSPGKGRSKPSLAAAKNQALDIY